MSYSQQKPRYDNTNALGVINDEEFAKRALFAGILIGGILYGTRKIPSTCPAVRVHFVCSVYPRDPRRGVLPMYGYVIQPRPSQRGGYQVRTRILHRGHVFVRDRTHRDAAQQSTQQTIQPWFVDSSCTDWIGVA